MKKFILLAERRSGTSLLIDCLNTYGPVHCAKRVFAIDKKVLNPDENNHSSDYYLYRIACLSNRLKFFFNKKALVRQFLDKEVFKEKGIECSGFRLIYDKADQYPEVVKWCCDNDIKVIHLVRENILKTHISMLTARVHKMHHPREGDKVKYATIELEAESLLDVLNAREHNVVKKSELFEGGRYLELSYESFIENRKLESERLTSFLGIPYTGDLKSDLVKINPSKLSDVVSNFSEVSTVLKGTKFEKYLI